MATLRDISQETGFSISVVSRALNKNPDAHAYVSSETREVIRRAAQKLNFRPNRNAEFLKRGKSATIGVFLPPYANRLLADLVFGISEGAEKHNFPLSLAFGLSESSYETFLENILDVSHSGIITYPVIPMPLRLSHKLNAYHQQGGNVVTLNSATENSEFPVINIDDHEGGRLAAEHLLGRGCKDFIACSIEDHKERRIEGFVNELHKCGKDCNCLLKTSVEQFTAYLEAKKNFPIGVFCITDICAMQLLPVMRSLGLRINRDVLIIGYDDLDTAKFFDPPLTTIRQPFREEGLLAVEKVVRMIYGKQEASEKLLPELIVRKTA